jgi:hypothetical protein
VTRAPIPGGIRESSVQVSTAARRRRSREAPSTCGGTPARVSCRVLLLPAAGRHQGPAAPGHPAPPVPVASLEAANHGSGGAARARAPDPGPPPSCSPFAARATPALTQPPPPLPARTPAPPLPDPNIACLPVHELSGAEIAPVCLAPASPGDLRCKGDETEPRWAWDAAAGRCAKFGYYGCGGNSNNFGSEVECVSVCTGVTGGCSQCASGLGGGALVPQRQPHWGSRLAAAGGGGRGGQRGKSHPGEGAMPLLLAPLCSASPALSSAHASPRPTVRQPLAVAAA